MNASQRCSHEQVVTLNDCKQQSRGRHLSSTRCEKWGVSLCMQARATPGGASVPLHSCSTMGKEQGDHGQGQAGRQAEGQCWGHSIRQGGHFVRGAGRLVAQLREGVLEALGGALRGRDCRDLAGGRLDGGGGGGLLDGGGGLAAGVGHLAAGGGAGLDGAGRGELGYGGGEQRGGRCSASKRCVQLCAQEAVLQSCVLNSPPRISNAACNDV